jgi:DNA adenine methylase
MGRVGRLVFQFSSESSKHLSDFVKSPFRYPGGKFYGVRLILPFLNCVPHDEYREPFLGGGTIFFAKPKVQYNWLNDLEPDLICTYKVIADEANRKRLMQRLSKEIATRDRHEEIKKMEATSVLDIACKTFYLNRTSYSGIIHNPAWGYCEGKSSPPQNWGRFIEPAGRKLADVEITTKDFEEVITAEPQGETVLMYLDPPYYHADQKRAYEKHFLKTDHERLASRLHETDYFFCLSYDDCPEIRELYSWAEIYERSWLYNTANVKGRNTRIGARELVITNYKAVLPEQMTLL